MSMESVDIIQGHCPAGVLERVDSVDNVMNSLDIVHGHCPAGELEHDWTGQGPWTMSTESMEIVH